MTILKKIIKALMPYGVYGILKELYPRIKYKSLRRRKYKGYKPAGGYGDKMLPYIFYVKTGTDIKVSNVFEIGANFAQDADFLMELFDLKPKDVYVFEAHPEIYEAVTRIHSFHAYNNAVFNENKEICFNIYPLDFENNGMSSIHRLYWKAGGIKEIKVQSIRMDNFMEEHGIEKIDFLKIDAEGATYEVLEGFGKKLKDVKCIQLEAEHGDGNFPDGWVLYEKIENILRTNDFELVFFERNNGMRQSDSFWVQKKCIKYTQPLS